MQHCYMGFLGNLKNKDKMDLHCRRKAAPFLLEWDPGGSLQRARVASAQPERQPCSEVSAV